jgi:hypothetical protein
MLAEKYKRAWEKFQNKMADLRKRRSEILTRISEKLDKQHKEALRKKLEEHEQRTSDN